MVQENKTGPVVFCGRGFSTTEIKLICEVVADFGRLSLTEIARTICEMLEWKRPNGRLKNHECRLLLEKLSAKGVFSLPALRQSGPRGPRVVTCTANGREQEPITGGVSQFAPLSLAVVRSGPESSLWNDLIERYHYRRYRVPVGANLRYFVRSQSDHILGCMCGPVRRGRCQQGMVGSAGRMSKGCATFSWSLTTRAFSSCPGFAFAIWRAPFFLCARGNFLTTGNNSTATARGFSRQLSTRSFAAPVTAQPTGFISAKLVGEAEWTTAIRPTDAPSSRSSSILYLVMCKGR